MEDQPKTIWSPFVYQALLGFGKTKVYKAVLDLIIEVSTCETPKECVGWKLNPILEEGQEKWSI